MRNSLLAVVAGLLVMGVASPATAGDQSPKSRRPR